MTDFLIAPNIFLKIKINGLKFKEITTWKLKAQVRLLNINISVQKYRYKDPHPQAFCGVNHPQAGFHEVWESTRCSYHS